MVIEMKVVLQRVNQASVMIENQCINQIEQGFVLLVGITHIDDLATVAKMADKIAGLRIFTDEQGKMNLSLADVAGEILSISQFTLYADCRKGRRPSFDMAARPEQAKPLYEQFNQCLRQTGILVKTGEFGADMKVALINDGPVTILLDSNEL